MLFITVMTYLAAESLKLKIKMAKNSESGNQTAKSQISESLSLKNWAVKFLLEKSVGKKSDGKNITLKIRQKIEGKKNTRQNFAVEYPRYRSHQIKFYSYLKIMAVQKSTPLFDTKARSNMLKLTVKVCS